MLIDLLVELGEPQFRSLDLLQDIPVGLSMQDSLDSKLTLNLFHQAQLLASIAREGDARSIMHHRNRSDILHMGLDGAEKKDSHLDDSEHSLGQSSPGLAGRQPFLMNLCLSKMREGVKLRKGRCRVKCNRQG